jgi:hypothetical protein
MRIERVVLLFVVLVLSSATVRSGDVDIGRARKVATNFYAEKCKIMDDQIFFGEEHTILNKGIVIGYVFNLNDGFIIISGTDAVIPVLAYSFESGYSGHGFPPAFDFWMENYKSQIRIAINEDRESLKSIREIWERYSDSNFNSKEVLSEVQPLIHTTWHQGCYYNSYFPEESTAPCGHLWTGCVATAMGQIMKFYNYPKNGTGTYGYNSSYGYVEADFENTEYDWIAMNYHLTDEDSSVAQLLYHCAISIHSQFYPNGTGAFDFDARSALVNYFKYKPDAHFYWRDSYPGDWKAMLRAELDEGRPVLYGGADSQTNAGHTLVCDGYQDTSFFHFNWGWNGIYNGYFYLDSLIAGNNYFDFQHDAVIGIAPDVGEIFIYPPLNLAASVISSSVTITWLAPELPSNLEFLGYNVFRNSNIVNSQILTELSFIDLNVPAGWQQYTASAVYIGGEKICPQFIEVFVEGSGINDQQLFVFNIFPNPVTNCLYISYGIENITDFIIAILDLAGRKLFEQYIPNFNSSEISIPVSELNSGIYLISIHNDQFRYYQKIVIRK